MTYPVSPIRELAWLEVQKRPGSTVKQVNAALGVEALTL